MGTLGSTLAASPNQPSSCQVVVMEGGRKRSPPTLLQMTQTCLALKAQRATSCFRKSLATLLAPKVLGTHACQVAVILDLRLGPVALAAWALKGHMELRFQRLRVYHGHPQHYGDRALHPPM